VPAIGGSKGRKNQKTTPLQQLSIAVIETPAELKQLGRKQPPIFLVKMYWYS